MTTLDDYQRRISLIMLSVAFLLSYQFLTIHSGPLGSIFLLSINILLLITILLSGLGKTWVLILLFIAQAGVEAYFNQHFGSFFSMWLFAAISIVQCVFLLGNTRIKYLFFVLFGLASGSHFLGNYWHWQPIVLLLLIILFGYFLENYRFKVINLYQHIIANTKQLQQMQKQVLHANQVNQQLINYSEKPMVLTNLTGEVILMNTNAEVFFDWPFNSHEKPRQMEHFYSHEYLESINLQQAERYHTKQAPGFNNLIFFNQIGLSNKTTARLKKTNNQLIEAMVEVLTLKDGNGKANGYLFCINHTGQNHNRI